jgi:hypothetical protein
VLSRLDGERKGRVVQFLYEANLITGTQRIIDLSGADLRKAELSEANLRSADLSRVNLSEANLEKSELRAANLAGATLMGANLMGAGLELSFLAGTNMRRASLRETRLLGAQLGTIAGKHPGARSYATDYVPVLKTDLRGADLTGADGSQSDVQQDFPWSPEEVLLEGATMPTGDKYEDWVRKKQDYAKSQQHLKGLMTSLEAQAEETNKTLEAWKNPEAWKT